jgi:hypothetical protein
VHGDVHLFSFPLPFRYDESILLLHEFHATHTMHPVFYIYLLKKAMLFST